MLANCVIEPLIDATIYASVDGNVTNAVVLIGFNTFVRAAYCRDRVRLAPMKHDGILRGMHRLKLDC